MFVLRDINYFSVSFIFLFEYCLKEQKTCFFFYIRRDSLLFNFGHTSVLSPIRCWALIAHTHIHLRNDKTPEKPNLNESGFMSVNKLHQSPFSFRHAPTVVPITIRLTKIFSITVYYISVPAYFNHLRVR